MHDLRFPLLVVLALGLTHGCERGESETNETPAHPASDSWQPLVEERDSARLEWHVTSDGEVRVRVSAGGKPINPDVLSGTVRTGGKTVVLAADDAELAGEIGTLQGELTELSYDIALDKTSWRGVLHLPPGGTAALLAEPSVAPGAEQRGPNGGLVEMVGDRRVELLVDEATGEVRVYLLDDKLQPIDVGDAEITIGFEEAP